MSEQGGELWKGLRTHLDHIVALREVLLAFFMAESFAARLRVCVDRPLGDVRRHVRTFD